MSPRRRPRLRYLPRCRAVSSASRCAARRTFQRPGRPLRCWPRAWSPGCGRTRVLPGPPWPTSTRTAAWAPSPRRCRPAMVDARAVATERPSFIHRPLAPLALRLRPRPSDSAAGAAEHGRSAAGPFLPTTSTPAMRGPRLPAPWPCRCWRFGNKARCWFAWPPRGAGAAGRLPGTGSYPLWGLTYYRWWLADRLTETVPIVPAQRLGAVPGLAALLARASGPRWCWVPPPCACRTWSALARAPA